MWITVSPGARENQIDRTDQGIRARIAAPASEGKANAELLAFLAKKLGVAKSSISILKGVSSRHKLIGVEDIDEADLLKRLQLPL